jgi:hypothetical protein
MKRLEQRIDSMKLRTWAKSAWILWEHEWSFYWPIIRKFGDDAFSVTNGGNGPEMSEPFFPIPHLTGVHCLGFVLSRENFERLTKGSTLDFPDICCGCSDPSTRRVSASPHRRFTLRDVPVCDRCYGEQRDGSAPVLATLNPVPCGKLQSINLVAKSPLFLRETAARNNAGELLPPWFFYDDDDITGMRHAFCILHRWFDKLYGSTNEEREELLKSSPPGWKAWIEMALRTHPAC